MGQLGENLNLFAMPPGCQIIGHKITSKIKELTVVVDGDALAVLAKNQAAVASATIPTRLGFFADPAKDLLILESVAAFTGIRNRTLFTQARVCLRIF